MQISLCLSRGFARTRADIVIVVTSAISQQILALLVGSVFYNLQQTTDALFNRSAVLFLATLLNAFQALLAVH